MKINQRTLRRWKKEGCPSDPEKALAWGVANKKRASVLEVGNSASAAADQVGPSTEKADVAGLIDELGLLGACARLRKLERHHYSLLRAAEERGDLAEAAARARLHNEAVDSLRLTEKSAFELEVLQKKFIEFAEVEREVGLMAHRCKTLLRSKFENQLPPQLTGLDAAEIQLRCRSMVDEVCRVLSESDYISTGVLPEAPGGAT